MPSTHILQLWQVAERHLQQGRLQLAMAGYRQLAGDPEMAPMAHLRLSLVAQSLGRYRESVDEALAADASRIEDPDLLEMIAKRLFRLGELEPAVALERTDPRSSGASQQGHAQQCPRSHCRSSGPLPAEPIMRGSNGLANESSARKRAVLEDTNSGN